MRARAPCADSPFPSFCGSITVDRVEGVSATNIAWEDALAFLATRLMNHSEYASHVDCIGKISSTNTRCK